MNKEETTTMNVYKKDIRWLSKIKEKMRKSALEDVLRSIINVIKHHKMEQELK